MTEVKEAEKMSFYAHGKRQKSDEVISRTRLADNIRHGEWEDLIADYQEATKSSTQRNKKSALPLFTPSIITGKSRQAELDFMDFSPTGLVAVCFEKEDEDLFDKLKSDPHVAMVYHGIDAEIVSLFKVEMSRTEEAHKLAVAAVHKYCESSDYKGIMSLANNLGATVLVSHDPGCVDKDAEPLLYKESLSESKPTDSDDLDDSDAAMAEDDELSKQQVIEENERIEASLERMVNVGSANEHEQKNSTYAIMKMVEEEAGAPLFFHRRGVLYRLAEDDTQLIPLLKDKIPDIITEHIGFYRITKENKMIYTLMPTHLINTLFSSGDEFAAEVKTLYHHHVILPDYSITSGNGYYEEIKSYMSADVESPQLDPANISESDVEWALEMVDKLLSGFVFENEASRTNFIGYIITHPLHAIIKGNKPMLVVHAPKPGTGKTLLLDAPSLIWTGEEFSRHFLRENKLTDSDELEKKIIGVLNENPESLVFDNVTRDVGDTLLSLMLTGSKVTGRLLGKSHPVNLEINAILAINGNNIQIVKDMMRRVYWVRLKTTTMDLSAREFEIPDLPAWILENRADLQRAFFILILNGLKEGTPASTVNFPSFNSWARMIDQILSANGIEEFLAPQEEVVDEDLAIYCNMIEVIFGEFGRDPFSMSDILHIASYLDPVEKPLMLPNMDGNTGSDDDDRESKESHDYLGDKVTGKTERGRAGSLGRIFQSEFNDNIFGGHRVVKIPRTKFGTQYKLVDITEGADDDSLKNESTSNDRVRSFFNASALENEVLKLTSEFGVNPFTLDQLSKKYGDGGIQIATFLQLVSANDEEVNNHKVKHSADLSKFRFSSSSLKQVETYLSSLVADGKPVAEATIDYLYDPDLAGDIKEAFFDAIHSESLIDEHEVSNKDGYFYFKKG